MVESMLSASLDSRSATTYRSGPSAGAAITAREGNVRRTRDTVVGTAGGAV